MFEPLVAFVERKLLRPWTSIALTYGTSERLDEVFAPEIGERGPADLAILMGEMAQTDAKANRRGGPYFVWICRTNGAGEPTPPVERFPLTFEECAATEANERSSLLATQRELGIRQTDAFVSLMNQSLQFARLASERREAEVERAERYATRMEQNFAQAQAHNMGMANLLFTSTKESVAGAQAASAALIAGDERRRALIAETRNQQVFAAVASNLDVLIPAVASGWMKANGAGGDPDMIAEHRLIKEFLTSLRDDQYASIGSILPGHLRQGVLDIYTGKMAAALIPAATAKIFAQIDGHLAEAIYAKLDPAVSDPTNIVQMMDPEGNPLLNPDGAPIMGPAMKQSRQQELFAQLWRTKENTMLARGEAANKAAFGG